jgi:PAS domain S-box-containing protein
MKKTPRQVSDNENPRPVITDSMLAKWQAIIDLVIEIIGVPAGLINRVSDRHIEVFIANAGPKNPFTRGQKFPRQDDIYCLGAIARGDLLVIADARKEDSWKHSPDLDYGMVSYMGYPVFWPDGVPFGTLCVLDTKPNAYSDLFKKFLRQSCDLIEHDLRLLTETAENVRRESQRLSDLSIQSFFENAPFAFQALDADGLITDVNQTWLTLLGYENKADILGRWFGDFLAPDFIEHFKLNFPLVTAKDAIHNLEFQMQKKDGTLIWISTNGRVINDDQGKLVCTQSLMRDITAQRWTEAALRRSEEVTRNLLNATDDTAFLLDLDGRFVALNDAMANRLGIAREALIGKEAYSLLPPDLIERKKAQVQQAITTRQPVRFEDVFQETMLDYQMFPVFDASDNVVQVAIYVHDITERKRIHDTLAANEQRLSLAQQAAKAGVWDWDMVTNKINWSAEYRRLMNDQTNEPSYANWMKLIHPEDLPRILAEKKSATDKTGHNLEYRIRRSDGSIRWINDRGEVICDDTGKPVRMVGICMDITERKQAEIETRNLALVVQNSSEGVCLSDLNGRIVFANEAGCQMVGIPRHEIVGRMIYDVMSDSCFEMAKSEVVPSIMKHGCWEGDLQYHDRRTGKITDVHVTTFLIKDPNSGQPLFLANISHDITEQKRIEQTLREDEEKYRATFENTGTAAVLIEEDTTISLVNMEFQRLSGYTREEIEGKKSWTEFVVKEDLERMLAQHGLRREDKEKALNRYEFRFIGKSGEVRNIFLSIDLIPGSKRSIASLLDVTESKRAEQAVRESEERYRDIFNTTLEGLYQTTPEGRYQNANPAFARMLGYESPQELMDSVIDISRQLYVDPKDREELVRRLASDKKLIAFETRLYKKDGTIIWALINAVAKTNASGKVECYLGGMIDITDRKRAEQALLESEEKYRATFENTGTAVIVVEEDTTITLANTEFQRLFGYSREELEGKKSWTEFVVKEDLERMLAQHKLRRQHPHEALNQYEFRFITRTGEIGDAFLTIDIIPGSKKSVASMLDITERKRADKALRQGEAKYRALIETTGTGSVIVDGNGRVIDANSEYARLSGHAGISELLGRNVLEWTAPYDREKNAAAVRTCYADGNIRNFEIDYCAPDGRIIPIEINASVVQMDGPPQILALCRDISERRRAEAELRQSESVLRSIFDAAPSGVALIVDRKLRKVNNCLCRISGYSEEELEGQCTRILYPDDEIFETVGKNLYDQVARDGFGMAEARLRRKDGQGVDALICLSPFDPQDYSKGVTATVLDISEVKRVTDALRASERKFSELAELLPVAIWESDMEMNLTYVNRQALRDSQYTQADFDSGIKTFSMIAPQDHERSGQILEELLRGETPDDHSLTLIRKDGSTFPAIARTNLIKQDGKPIGFRGVVMDITGRKLAEDALRESEKKFSELAELLPVTIWESDLQGNITYVNRQALQDNLYTQKDLDAGVNIFSLVAPGDLDRTHQFLAGLLRGEIIDDHELSIVRKDGTIYPVIAYTNVIKRDGQPIGFRGITINNSDRKSAEKAIRESEERFRTVFENAQDNIFIKDVDGRYISVNSSFARLFEQPIDRIVGKTDVDLFDSETAANIKILNQRVLEGEVVDLETTFPINGNPRTFHIIKSPMKDGNGNIIGISGIARDITDKKRMEAELLRADKLDSLGLLAGGIAHDFNNILTAVLGNVSFAKMDLEPRTDAFACLDDVEKATLRAKDLTQQLLTFSKGGAPIKESSRIEEIVIDSAQFALRGSKVKCQFSIAGDLNPANVDRGQISQVISNLVINADQAMPVGGTIQIGADNHTVDEQGPLPLKPGPYIHVTVADQGTGIPENLLSKIFDPFFTTKQKGNGLGLATTYSIVKKHDGYIRVESEPGIGTIFHIYLPATAIEAPHSVEPDWSMTPGSGRILVMDDETPICQMTAKCLGRLGYEVTCTADGTDAVAAYRDAIREGHPFDVVILDLTVPGGMGGRETIALLKQLAPDVKAIVSSGYSNDPEIAEFAEFGFCGRITKPFKAGDLARVVGEVMSLTTEAH